MAACEQIVIYFLVIFSALLAATAFLCPLYCAEFIFIFLVPLFYLIYKDRACFTYQNGFLWGMTFYLMVFFDIFQLIIEKGFGFTRMVAIFLLFSYGIIIAIVWFLLARIVSSISGSKIIGLSIATYAYCLFIEHSFFLIFGFWEANSLHHFVLPLAIRSQWLYYIGHWDKNFFFMYPYRKHSYKQSSCA